MPEVHAWSGNWPITRQKLGLASFDSEFEAFLFVYLLAS